MPLWFILLCIASMIFSVVIFIGAHINNRRAQKIDQDVQRDSTINQALIQAYLKSKEEKQG